MSRRFHVLEFATRMTQSAAIFPSRCSGPFFPFFIFAFFFCFSLQQTLLTLFWHSEAEKKMFSEVTNFPFQRNIMSDSAALSNEKKSKKPKKSATSKEGTSSVKRKRKAKKAKELAQPAKNEVVVEKKWKKRNQLKSVVRVTGRQDEPSLQSRDHQMDWTSREWGRRVWTAAAIQRETPRAISASNLRKFIFCVLFVSILNNIYFSNFGSYQFKLRNGNYINSGDTDQFKFHHWQGQGCADIVQSKCIQRQIQGLQTNNKCWWLTSL